MEGTAESSVSSCDPVNPGNTDKESQTSSHTNSELPVSPYSSSSHKCGLCGATFSNLAQYLVHRVSDHAGQEKGMNCELCGTAYSRQITLREHYKKKHRINFNNKTPQTSIQTKPLHDRKKEKVGSTEKTKENHAVVSEENPDVGDDETTAQTIHVIITKTDEGEGTNSDIVSGREEAGTKMTGGEGSSDMLRTGLEDMSVGDNRGQLMDGHHSAEIDKLTTVMSNAADDLTDTDGLENMDIDKTLQMMGEDVNLDLGPDPGSSPRKGSKSGTNGPLLGFDESEDFHFVLLKNMINGNSFKYSKDRFKCLHCEFKSYWRNSMCSHMKEFHKDMMSIHQFIEIKPPEMNNTQPDQTIIKMSDYIASLHQKKTKSSQYRIRNVEKQDLPGHFPCTKCDKAFNRLRYLRKHMLVHRTDKKYLCDECGKAFKTRSYLKTHYKTHALRLYKCSQCNFSSSVNAVIHAHRQLHNDGSVICDVCGFAYADKSTLKKHQTVHDPSRPFPCTFPGCTWRFKTKVMCLAHYNAHTTEGKFRCSVCGYVFRHKHHLQRHQGKMHGITNMTNVTIVEEDKKDEKDNEVSDVPDTVSLIVNSDFSRDQLQSALQNGQLVIATDSEGNTINYEVADITMNVTYHTLLEDESELGDTQTVLHVATIDSQEDTL